MYFKKQIKKLGNHLYESTKIDFPLISKFNDHSIGAIIIKSFLNKHFFYKPRNLLDKEIAFQKKVGEKNKAHLCKYVGLTV